MRLILLVLFCSTSVTVASQDVFPLVAYWDEGEIFDFRVTKVKSILKDDHSISSDTLSYISRFEVVDSTESQYTIKWSYDGYDKNVITHPNLRFLPELANYKAVEVIYTTDELGALDELQNGEVIGKSMKERLVDYTEKFNRQGLSNEFWFRLYESPTGLLYSVFKELTLFHNLFGLEYPIKEKISYQEPVPNPLGSEYAPLMQDVDIFCTGYDSTYQVTFERNSRFNRQSLQNFISELTEEGLDLTQSSTSHFTYLIWGVPLLIQGEFISDTGQGFTMKDEIIIEIITD